MALKRYTQVGRATGWKPLSLSTPVLATWISLCLLLCAVIEILAQRSQAQGGLALSSSQDDIPQYVMLSYLYLPTIIAISYSLIWTWIDLDVKRMQPWFQLSKPNGALAKDSAFLDYPSEFIAVVPFKAARRKHWPVFFSGTSMVLIFITARSSLAAPDQQWRKLTAKIKEMACNIGLLNQSYPSFATRKFALLPFYIEDGTGTDR
ncbi:hypothetical protein B0T10DRAFT_577284 [Thelonectria olida]|uniref:Uncharacterized protein n=1 Tax=Thelonectria olida TaxID=1576542 RepID=A0A9P9AMH4_9HYPO|nr:hypothetical protein B0T10DRAFT_577284 [Thelonectria olida]